MTEFYNLHTRHYFMTADPEEVAAIEAGKSGPGWVKTGRAFKAFPVQTFFGTHCDVDCGVPVARFYGPGPNSHVFTADPVEAQILKRPGSGWIFERDEFRIPQPDASGQCAAGWAPVVRLYNDRFYPFNDANHRYVTREEERAKMRLRGWIDEGARLCSPESLDVPIASFEMKGDAGVHPSAWCEDETLSLGPCVAVNNLPVPSYLRPVTYFDIPTEFFDRTGFTSPFNYVLPEAAYSTPTQAAQLAFVQGRHDLLGVHVATPGRGASIYSSVNPLYQFRTFVGADGRDQRVFPFGVGYESDAELVVSGNVNVKRLRVANASSHAYGHPTLEFIDKRSGQHVYFTALAYGTVDPSGDYLAPDVGTGKVIVGTGFRPVTPYGRSAGIPTLPTPAPFDSPNYWGWGGPFEFRIDRAEFQRIIDAARTLNPALSPEVADYMIDNYHFNNEVVGDGEIGLNLAGFKLQLLRK